MKLGLHVAATEWRGGPGRFGRTLAEVVEAAEAAGFDAVSVTDHVWGSRRVGFTNRTDVVTLASGERLVGQRDRCREHAEYRLRVMRALPVFGAAINELRPAA